MSFAFHNPPRSLVASFISYKNSSLRGIIFETAIVFFSDCFVEIQYLRRYFFVFMANVGSLVRNNINCHC